MSENKKISEIKAEFEAIQHSNESITSDSNINHEYDKLFEQYQTDTRAGVQKIIEKYKKIICAYQDELLRMEKLKQFEKKYYEYTYICGIDEVGRGPLAGPVCAGAVILPKDCNLLYINDSKQLTAKRREELYIEIKKNAISAETAFMSHEVIDEINILQATYRAMREAVGKLKYQPDLLLNDAVTIPLLNIKQVPIIKGDAKSISIGAASIIAKVERDHLMEQYDELYPEYGFASNKGYGSKQHLEALKKYGPCPIHRMSFIKGLI